MAEIDDDIAAMETAAASPQSVTVDGQTVSQVPIKDRIELAKFKQSQSAAADPAAAIRGMSFKLVPPGAP